MKQVAKTPLLVFTSLCLLFLSGCGDYRKINDRAQVIGIGVDPIENDPAHLRYTFQIPNLEHEGLSSGPSMSANLDYKNFVVDGVSLHTALAKAQTEYNKGFFFGNLESVVLNTHLTERNYLHVTEQLMRDETADKMASMIATNVPAQDILSVKTTTPPATTLESMWQVSLAQRGYTANERLWRFWRDAETVGLQTHLPLVEIDGDNLHIDGTELFIGYTPTSSMSSDDTVFYNLMARKLHHLNLTIPDKDKTFDIKYTKSKSKISVSILHGRPVLHDKIRVHAALASNEDHGESPVSQAEFHRYEQVMNVYFRQECTRVLRELQDKQIDVIGFGQWFAISNQDQIERVRANWGQMFRNATVDIQVTSHIVHSGNLL